MSKKIVKNLLLSYDSDKIEYLRNNLITLPVVSGNLYSVDSSVEVFKEVQLLRWSEDHYITVAYDTYVTSKEVDEFIELLTEINNLAGYALFSLNI